MANIHLFDYARSSACYRVRIALNLKGLAYQAIDTSLADNAHLHPDYRAMNPQGFVPMIEIDGVRLTQSLAIIDYLDALFPSPRLIPQAPDARARAMAQALTIACDIHPLNNLRVMRYLERTLSVDESDRADWYRTWISEGFKALEPAAAQAPHFLGGASPGIADVLLVPQMVNARRLATPLALYPNLVRIDAALQAIPAFAAAHPDQ